MRSARVVDLGHGGSRVVSWVDLNFGYRTSSIAPNEVVVSAELKLDPGSVESGEEALAEIVRWRRDNQPGGQNAGSVFTNPVGDSAGRLIDAAGCKGLRHGSAEVSVKHANFIQCDAEGRSGDVLALMSLVRARVEERFGVALEPETRLLGFDEVPEWAVSAVVTTTTGMGAAE